MKKSEVLFVTAIATLTTICLHAVEQETRYRKQKREVRERFGIRRGERFERICTKK